MPGSRDKGTDIFRGAIIQSTRILEENREGRGRKKKVADNFLNVIKL